MNRFLLLLGPSGVGKSSIISQLRQEDERFAYISPYITRPLREGEKDKVYIPDAEMDQMVLRDEFLVINELYGVRYATPRQPIVQAFSSHKFPILDWPIQKLSIMEETFKDKLYKVYVFPPSVEELKLRIDRDGRDTEGKRFSLAAEELKQFHSGKFDSHIDLKVESTLGEIKNIGKFLHSKYLESIGELGSSKEKRI